MPVTSAAPELRFRVEHARCKLVLFDADRAALVQEALRGAGAAARQRVELAEPRARTRRRLACAAGRHRGRAMPRCCSTPRARPESPRARLSATRAHAAHRSARASRAALERQRSRARRAAAHAQLRLPHGDAGQLLRRRALCARAALRHSAHVGAARTRSDDLDSRSADDVAAWAAEPGPPRFPALRWCLSAGAPLADETARRAEAAWVRASARATA